MVWTAVWRKRRESRKVKISASTKDDSFREKKNDKSVIKEK